MFKFAHILLGVLVILSLGACLFIAFSPKSQASNFTAEEIAMSQILRNAKRGDIVEFKNGRLGRIYLNYPTETKLGGVEMWLQYPGEIHSRSYVEPRWVRRVYAAPHDIGRRETTNWEHAAALYALQGLEEKTARK